MNYVIYRKKQRIFCQSSVRRENYIGVRKVHECEIVQKMKLDGCYRHLYHSKYIHCWMHLTEEYFINYDEGCDQVAPSTKPTPCIISSYRKIGNKFPFSWSNNHAPIWIVCIEVPKWHMMKMFVTLLIATNGVLGKKNCEYNSRISRL